MKFHSYQRAGVAALLTHPALFPQPAVEGLYVVRQTGPLGGRVTREVRATPETIVDVAFRGASVDTKVEWTQVSPPTVPATHAAGSTLKRRPSATTGATLTGA